MAQPTVGEALSAMLKRLAPAGLVSAYLYGSHAEGRSHRESDVDVGLLLDRRCFPTERARFDERVRIAGVLAGELAPNVDVVVLNDVPPHLGRHVVATGVRVYCIDAELDHVFVRDVQLRAADLEPFLRRMRQIKLAAIGR